MHGLGGRNPPVGPVNTTATATLASDLLRSLTDTTDTPSQQSRSRATEFTDRSHGGVGQQAQAGEWSGAVRGSGRCWWVPVALSVGRPSRIQYSMPPIISLTR
jgi:hypothetical protein